MKKNSKTPPPSLHPPGKKFIWVKMKGVLTSENEKTITISERAHLYIVSTIYVQN